MAASLLMASNTLLRLPRSSPYSTSGPGLKGRVSTRLKSKVSLSSSRSPPLLTQAPPNPSLPSLAILLAIAIARPPNSLFFAAISGLPLLPPAPPIYSPRNPAPLFRRNLSKPTTLTFPLRPPKNCKLVASYSAPLQIPTRNHNHSQFTVAWPLFFAVISPQIFGCVLLIRVLLSWFPNIQWDNQPMSAIRDLCDPYLSLFRGIIPPVFNSLDVSPIFAFVLLGMLGQLARPLR